MISAKKYRRRNEIITKRGDILKLGTTQFDPRTGMLSDPLNGPIAIREQSLRVLAYLAERKNSVVLKEDLIASVWPDTFVTDDSLVQCIKEIRLSIGDGNRQIIETLVKRGYRLNIPDPPLLECYEDEIPRVVVLGFQNNGLDATRNNVGEVLADGLISELANFGEFSVVSRHSSLQFRNAATAGADVASQLNVQYAIEGGHTITNGELRVSVRLIEMETHTSVWTHSYQLNLDKMADVQSELVSKIAASIGYRIREHAPSLITPENQNAMLLFLHSDADVQMPSLDAINRAIEINTLAVKIEPNSPYGYIGLSFAYLAKYLDRWETENPADNVQRAIKNADKALALSPRNSQAHFASGEAHLAADNLDQAEVRFARSLELNPHAPHVWASSACILLFKGENEKALLTIDRAINSDPERPDWFLALKSAILRQSGDFESALATFQEMAVVPGSNYMNLSAILAGLGRQDEAQAAIAKFLEKTPHHTVTRERAAVEAKFKKNEHLNAWLGLIRKAGLPEG